MNRERSPPGCPAPYTAFGPGSEPAPVYETTGALVASQAAVESATASPPFKMQITLRTLSSVRARFLLALGSSCRVFQLRTITPRTTIEHKH